MEADSLARAVLARMDEQKPEQSALFVVARTTLGKALLAQGFRFEGRDVK